MSIIVRDAPFLGGLDGAGPIRDHCLARLMADSFSNPLASDGITPTSAVPAKSPTQPAARSEHTSNQHTSGAGRLLALMAALAIVTAAPYLIGQVVYEVRLNQLQA